MFKILIVDDHRIVRDGLTLYLQSQTELPMPVVTGVASGTEALKSIELGKPDIVLLDFFLPDMTGEEVMRDMLVSNPDLKIIILTGNNSNTIAEKLLNAGARGFVGKSLGAQDVIDAIKVVMHGGVYIDASFTNLNIRSMLKREFRLSERECQILKLIANGCAGFEIASHLSISQKTVSTYKKRIREKLNAENNMELMRLAVQYGGEDITCSE